MKLEGLVCCGGIYGGEGEEGKEVFTREGEGSKQNKKTKKKKLLCVGADDVNTHATLPPLAYKISFHAVLLYQ